MYVCLGMVLISAMVIAACQAAQSDKSKWKKISEEGVETVSVTGTEGGYNFEIVE